MPSKNQQPQIPLPKRWGTHVKTAILHVVALAQYALTYSRSWAADSLTWEGHLDSSGGRAASSLHACCLIWALTVGSVAASASVYALTDRNCIEDPPQRRDGFEMLLGKTASKAMPCVDSARIVLLGRTGGAKV